MLKTKCIYLLKHLPGTLENIVYSCVLAPKQALFMLESFHKLTHKEDIVIIMLCIYAIKWKPWWKPVQYLCHTREKNTRQSLFMNLHQFGKINNQLTSIRQCKKGNWHLYLVIKASSRTIGMIPHIHTIWL